MIEVTDLRILCDLMADALRYKNDPDEISAMLEDGFCLWHKLCCEMERAAESGSAPAPPSTKAPVKKPAMVKPAEAEPDAELAIPTGKAEGKVKTFERLMAMRKAGRASTAKVVAASGGKLCAEDVLDALSANRVSDEVWRSIADALDMIEKVEKEGTANGKA